MTERKASILYGKQSKSQRNLSGAHAHWNMLANRLPAHLNMRAYGITKPGSKPSKRAIQSHAQCAYTKLFQKM
jgi:hypothetical protein